MIIYEITFYRRAINGWELSANRLFRTESQAIKILRFQGFKLIDEEENLYTNGKERATLIEKEVE